MFGVISHPKRLSLILAKDSAEVTLPPISGIKFLISGKDPVTPARVSLISSM